MKRLFFLIWSADALVAASTFFKSAVPAWFGSAWAAIIIALEELTKNPIFRNTRAPSNTATAKRILVSGSVLFL